MGWLTAITLLLELGDMSRSWRAEQLAAYVGLTLSQHRSAEKVRTGRMTTLGRMACGGLVESARRVIGKDPALRRVYERITMQAGAKRAIVATARCVLLRAAAFG